MVDNELPFTGTMLVVGTIYWHHWIYCIISIEIKTNGSNKNHSSDCLSDNLPDVYKFVAKGWIPIIHYRTNATDGRRSFGGSDRPIITANWFWTLQDVLEKIRHVLLWRFVKCQSEATFKCGITLLAVSRTYTSRFSHFFALFGASRTILHNFKKNWAEFRQLGRVETNAGVSSNTWVKLRQKLG